MSAFGPLPFPRILQFVEASLVVGDNWYSDVALDELEQTVTVRVRFTDRRGYEKRLSFAQVDGFVLPAEEVITTLLGDAGCVAPIERTRPPTSCLAVVGGMLFNAPSYLRKPWRRGDDAGLRISLGTKARTVVATATLVSAPACNASTSFFWDRHLGERHPSGVAVEALKELSERLDKANEGRSS